MHRALNGPYRPPHRRESAERGAVRTEGRHGASAERREDAKSEASHVPGFRFEMRDTSRTSGLRRKAACLAVTAKSQEYMQGPCSPLKEA